MKIDAGLRGGLDRAGSEARHLEELGYDGLISAETAHDPLFPLLLAAEHTERIELMTSIVVAFARSPMTLAAQAHDLNAYSRGRLILGLGSQIRPHITKRFSMPWSRPAARMREYVLALRAIWETWYQGKPLDFRGEFYTHTLMTPMFSPRDTEYGAPKVVVAAVGPKMTEAAAEVADGVIAHAFTTRRYLEETTLPAITRGLAKAGRGREEFQVIYPGFVVTGRDDQEVERNRSAVCKQIAFYGSTPAYRGVLEAHGWGDLQDELNAMSKRGLWDEMGTRISGEILDVFAVVAEPDRVASAFAERFGGIIDRTAITLPFENDVKRRQAFETLRA